MFVQRRFNFIRSVLTGFLKRHIVDGHFEIEAFHKSYKDCGLFLHFFMGYFLIHLNFITLINRYIVRIALFWFVSLNNI